MPAEVEETGQAKLSLNNTILGFVNNRPAHFPVVPSLCFKARVSAKLSYSHANKTHFHKRGFALRPRPNVELFIIGAKLSELSS